MQLKHRQKQSMLGGFINENPGSEWMVERAVPVKQLHWAVMQREPNTLVYNKAGTTQCRKPSPFWRVDRTKNALLEENQQQIRLSDSTLNVQMRMASAKDDSHVVVGRRAEALVSFMLPTRKSLLSTWGSPERAAMPPTRKANMRGSLTADKSMPAAAAADETPSDSIDSFGDILQLSIAILKEFVPNKESLSSFTNNFLRALSSLDATRRATIEQIVEGVLRHTALLNSLVDGMDVSFFASKDEPLKLKVFFWVVVYRLADRAVGSFASFVDALQLRTSLLLKLADFIFGSELFFETALKQHLDYNFVNDNVLSYLQKHQVRRHLLDAASNTEEHNRFGRTMQAGAGATSRKLLPTRCEPFSFTERLRPKIVDVMSPPPPPADDRPRRRATTFASSRISLEQLEKERVKRRQQALVNLVAKHAAHRRFALSDRKRESKASNVVPAAFASAAGEKRRSVSSKPCSHPKTTTTSTLRQALVLEREAEEQNHAALRTFEKMMPVEDGDRRGVCAEREGARPFEEQRRRRSRRRRAEREKRERVRAQTKQYENDKEEHSRRREAAHQLLRETLTERRRQNQASAESRTVNDRKMRESRQQNVQREKMALAERRQLMQQEDDEWKRAVVSAVRKQFFESIDARERHFSNSFDPSSTSNSGAPSMPFQELRERLRLKRVHDQHNIEMNRRCIMAMKQWKRAGLRSTELFIASELGRRMRAGNQTARVEKSHLDRAEQARLDLEQEMTKKRSEAAASAFRIAEQIRQQTTMLQQTSGTTMAQMESVELAGERAICTRQKQAMESAIRQKKLLQAMKRKP